MTPDLCPGCQHYQVLERTLAMSTNPDFLFYFFARGIGKTRICRLHGHKLKQSDHGVRSLARSFFQSGSLLTYAVVQFHPQTEKEKLYSCPCCQPSNKGGRGSILISDASLRSEGTRLCLWELSCGLTNTHCSCISGESGKK